MAQGDMPWEWAELQPILEPDGCGLLWMALSVADGRRTFRLEPEEILAKFSAMSRERFDEIIEQLRNYGLVRARAVRRGLLITLLQLPAGWHRRAPISR